MYRITELDADTNSEKFGAQRKCIAKRCSMLHTADYLMNNSTPIRRIYTALIPATT